MTQPTNENLPDSELTNFERDVLEKLFFGDDPILETLRVQLDHASVCGRELTGVGFYLYFNVSEKAPRIESKASFNFGDVIAEIESLQHGAGFVVFVKDGALDMLEGYSYDEQWPDKPIVKSLSYDGKSNRDIDSIRTAWST